MSDDKRPRRGHRRSCHRDTWMQTYSGGMFWPLDPRPEDVRIEDIAHHLSNVCRFGGACESHYSVAQHSVLVSLIVPPRLALAGLLHDASEAYLNDVLRPLKRWGPFARGYCAAEVRVQAAVCRALGVPLRACLSRVVQDADNVALATERRDLMKESVAPWKLGSQVLFSTVVPVRPEVAEGMFLDRYHKFVGARWVSA